MIDPWCSADPAQCFSGLWLWLFDARKYNRLHHAGSRLVYWRLVHSTPAVQFSQRCSGVVLRWRVALDFPAVTSRFIPQITKDH